MATTTQNDRHQHGNGHGHHHHNGDGHGHQEAVNPEDRPPEHADHNPRVNELPKHLADFIRDIEKKTGDSAPNSIIDELKEKIASGQDVKVESIEICNRENCPEHKNNPGLNNVLKNAIIGSIKDLVKARADAEKLKEEQSEAKREQQIGKYFVGKATCEACGTNPAGHVLLNHLGKDIDEQIESGTTFVKAVCTACYDVARKVVGEFLLGRMAAPCPLCVPYPIREGVQPNPWAALCGTHYQFAQIMKNS